MMNQSEGLISEPDDTGAGISDVPTSWRQRLADCSVADQQRLLLSLVLEHAKESLRGKSGAAVEADRPFLELGFDSLAAVDLHSRLAAATGLRLPVTLVFDHPTAASLAAPPARRAARPGRRPRCGRAARLGGRRAHRDRRRWPAASPAASHSPEELWQLVAGRHRRDLRLPGRPRLGPRRLYDPDPDQPGHQLRPGRRFPARRRRLRRRASSASRRARRWRWTRSSGCCWRPAWEAFERAGIDPGTLRGSRAPASSSAPTAQDYGPRRHEAAEGIGGLPGHRQRASVASGPARLHPRPRGPGGHRRHRLLLLAGRPAPGGAVAAPRRVRVALAGGVP